MSSFKKKIIFRADGNSQVGLGHIMRCVALADMLSRVFDCIFLINNPNTDLVQTLMEYGKVISIQSKNIVDEKIEIDALIKKEDIVVVDGYDFDEDYIRIIKEKANKVIIIDDLAERDFNVDLVINHASSEILDRYSRERSTKVLASPDYLIVRKQFLLAASKTREIKKVDTAFICFGGADFGNITLKVLKACLQATFLKHINVVIGSAYQHQSDLLTFIEENKSCKGIDLYTNLTAKGLVEVIDNSDLCVVPSSTIAMEVCCVKSGLLTGITVDNQKFIHNELVRSECAMSISNFEEATIIEILGKIQELNSVDLINTQIKNQSSKIDGRSGERLLEEFKLIGSC